MSKTARKKLQETPEVEPTSIYAYQNVYEGLKETFGQDNLAQMIGPFKLNNNADIQKGIEFCRNEIIKCPEEKAELESMIMDYKNIMKLGISVTQDLMSISKVSSSIPGPAIATETIQKAEVKEEKEVKTIVHPETKKKKKEKTVNDKAGEEIAAKRAENEKKNKEDVAKASAEDEKLPQYEKMFKTDAEKERAIDMYLMPVLNKYLEEKNMEKATQTCRIHFKEYGTRGGFTNDMAIKRFINWVESAMFPAVSPLVYLRGERLSVMHIIAEAERLIVELGLGEDELKDALKPYIMNVRLKEWKEEQKIDTQEGYDTFFERTLHHLLEEDNKRKAVHNYDQSQKDRAVVIEELIKEYTNSPKNSGWKAIRMVAKGLDEWVKTQGKEGNLQGRIAEVVSFIKSSNPELYKEYMDNAPHKQTKRGSDKPKTSKTEVKAEETIETDGDKGESGVEVASTKPVASPVVYNELEDQIKFQASGKDRMAEWLITLINKHVAPIGGLTSLDLKVEAITLLATKAFLEHGVKKCDDWTETDVAEFIANDVNPFVSDEYGILNSKNEEDLKQHLEFYLEKYPAGEEKKRTTAMKEVANSEIPRTDYMKGVVKKIKKGNMSQINVLIADINKKTIEEVKKK